VKSVSGDGTLGGSSSSVDPSDPLGIGRHRRENVSKKQIKIDHPKGNKKQIKKYYTRQNELIDKFLGADDEERAALDESIKYAPKIKFAVNASFCVNLFLFVIQMYAAITTGSLSVRGPAGFSESDRDANLCSSFLQRLPMRL